jgi:hypothetical protein
VLLVGKEGEGKAYGVQQRKQHDIRAGEAKPYDLVLDLLVRSERHGVASSRCRSCSAVRRRCLKPNQ